MYMSYINIKFDDDHYNKKNDKALLSTHTMKR
jgi:hypothetical protein